MQDFKKKELKDLKKLRAIAIGFLVLVNFIIIGFFIYNFYDVYRSRNLKENFITYVFPTVVSIQLVLAFVFAPLIIIIFRRSSSVLREIEALNDGFTFHYQRYRQFIYRLFPTVPLYLISQKGLFIFRNLKTELIPPNSIKYVEIKNINMGRFRRSLINIYLNDGSKSRITYYTTYPRAAEFFHDNIHLINDNVRVENLF
ncbi:hypothetical protein [Epilithonimonas lactis]|uniref:Uncharacterized protein n=1 Tax=Epilithonimonas lactis TaxID=421072 RepID=A0A085B963_9FLAO|nr:hypothetical protein [Epilithonimonas lactis]KFC19008.1 hypothetical protein IO89_15930 [Epilithonimonas lactis]SEQ95441.1 hypothetical protein SAMN04488097_3507 [Epilithonimonas lactis]